MIEGLEFDGSEGPQEPPRYWFYAMKYRPASFCTCPKGWRYAASGPSEPLLNRPELPRSHHNFGVIYYDAPLSKEDVEMFEMIEVPEPQGARHE